MSTAQLLGNIGEFFGAIAVVASLIFVGIQVRQSSRATNVETYQQIQTNWAAAARLLYGSPELSDLFETAVEDPTSLSGDERRRVDGVVSEIIFQMEDMFYLFERGSLDADLFMNQILNSPFLGSTYAQSLLDQRDGKLSARFRSFVISTFSADAQSREPGV